MAKKDETTNNNVSRVKTGILSISCALKAVCHVSDRPLQSEFNTMDFFVNLCI